MKLKNEKLWNEYVAKNTDPYGKCIVNVAKRVMELLDNENKVDARNLVMRAEKELKAGLTGFMAGAVASIVSTCHKKGEEFRKSWNNDVAIGDEGKKANDSGGVLNPAIVRIK